MDARAKGKEAAKNNQAAHSRKGEVQSRVAVLEREVRTAAQERNLWKAHVEALCAILTPGDRRR